MLLYMYQKQVKTLFVLEIKILYKKKNKYCKITYFRINIATRKYKCNIDK